MKLVLDEHLSPTIAERLRAEGHDVVAAEGVGLRQRPDEEVFEWAVANQRALVTRNLRDFRPIHARYLSSGLEHFGLVLVPGRYSLARAGFGQLTRALGNLLERFPEEHELESVEHWL